MRDPKKVKDNQIKDLVIRSQNSHNKEIDLPRIINSEVNLLVFPFFALSTKGLKEKEETEFRDIVERNGKKVEILWSVAAHAKYGYPGPFDREVHKAIERIITGFLKKYGYIENPICLGSLYNICSLMNIKKHGGYQYREIRSALERIKTTVIKSEGSFYYKGKKQWLSKVFSLYDSVIFKGEQLTNGQISDSNFIYLSDIYLQSLNSFYIKPVDYNYLKSLNKRVSSRLYEVLGVKFYGLRNKKENFICYHYSKLCQLLPVTPFSQLSRAKQQLNPSHDELKETGFIDDYQWKKNSKKDWFIYYYPGQRAKKEMKKEKNNSLEYQKEESNLGLNEPPVELNQEKNKLIKQLTDFKITKNTAEKLVQANNLEKIQQWIKAINYTEANNKAAYLVKAIKENWQVPENYLEDEKYKIKSEEKRKSVLKFKKREEDQRIKKLTEDKKLDKILDSLSTDDKTIIKGEAIKKLPSFIRNVMEKTEKEKKESRLVNATLKEKEREVLKEWLSTGKLKDKET